MMSAGVFLSRYGMAGNLFKVAGINRFNRSNMVAVTQGEIELVGDGAGSVLVTDEENSHTPDDHVILNQNYPNPFRKTTMIR